MPDDDDILDAYEREFDDVDPPRPRSGRGFWIVVGAIALACVVLVGEIFANRPIATVIEHAQFDLREAEAEALKIRSTSGSFAGANADGLNTQSLYDGRLTAVGPDETSSGLAEVSIYADETTWAAAVSARPGACFYLKLEAGRDDPLYGVGAICTAREALKAQDDRW